MHIFHDYENINILNDKSNHLIEEIINKCSNLMKDNEKLENEIKEKDKHNASLLNHISELKTLNKDLINFKETKEVTAIVDNQARLVTSFSAHEKKK